MAVGSSYVWGRHRYNYYHTIDVCAYIYIYTEESLISVYMGPGPMGALAQLGPPDF